jgi:hypothetical protein
MRAKLFFFIGMILPAISLCFGALPVKSARAEDGKIISIQAAESATSAILTMNPAELTVDKNIIVIWLNAIQDREVNIRFADGKTLKNATRDAMGFDMGKNGGYEAKYLPSIGTASLRFVKEGVYVYTIQSQPGGLEAKGKIVVR